MPIGRRRFLAALVAAGAAPILWASRPARLLAMAELVDTCGIARSAGAGAFIATGAGGRIACIDARTGELTVLAHSEGSRWDNHLLALGAPGQVRGEARQASP